MRTLTKILAAFAVLACVLGFLTACDDETPSGQSREDSSRQTNYNHLVKAQPAGTMSYSPTRATKNFWIKTWNEKGKLSYVYLMNSAGVMIGYYVLDGLPVSYCTSLIPPYQFKGAPNDGDTVKYVVPGPSVDGTFSSGSNCNTYYGKDATSGAYIEYTAGMGINVLLFDQPLPKQKIGDAQPLGPTSTDDVKKR